MSEQQLHARIGEVTERIAKRSLETRQRYLDQVRVYGQRQPRRAHLSCGNLAHGFAACDTHDKEALGGEAKSNIAIVSSYNDMLSAHQPLERFPALIKQAVREAGGGRMGWKWAAIQFVYMLGLAYVAALIVYQGGRALGLGA